MDARELEEIITSVVCIGALCCFLYGMYFVAQFFGALS